MPDENDTLAEILQNTAKTEERTRQIQKNLSAHQIRYEKEQDFQDRRLDRLEIKVQRQDIIIAAQLILATLLTTAVLNWAVGVF